MALLTHRDFESDAGRSKIITEIHALDRKIHDLELAVRKLSQTDTAIERELEGPEAY
jgi:hypothetical protein